MVHQRSRWNSDSQTGFIGSFDFRDLWWMVNAILCEKPRLAFFCVPKTFWVLQWRDRGFKFKVFETISFWHVQTSFKKKNNSVLWDFLSLERRWDNFARRKRDPETHITAKNETARSVKFDENLARPMSFEGPFATSWIAHLNPNQPKETRPKRNLTRIRREKIAINRRKTYFHGKNCWDLRWLRFNLRSSKHRDCSAQRLRTTLMSWRE